VLKDQPELFQMARHLLVPSTAFLLQSQLVIRRALRSSNSIRTSQSRHGPSDRRARRRAFTIIRPSAGRVLGNSVIITCWSRRLHTLRSRSAVGSSSSRTLPKRAMHLRRRTRNSFSSRAATCLFQTGAWLSDARGVAAKIMAATITSLPAPDGSPFTPSSGRFRPLGSGRLIANVLLEHSAHFAPEL
jgi:hypothetical protein